MKDTAIFPELFGPQYNLHFGFILVIIATIVVWWILSRSSLGFKFRAVGENPRRRPGGGHQREEHVHHTGC